MRFKDLKSCVTFLEKEGELVRVTEQVDPDLEMAAITRRVFKNRGPALFFENVKASPFPAVSNLFGRYERALKLLEPEFEKVKQLVRLRSDPRRFIKSPLKHTRAVASLLHAVPFRTHRAKVLQRQCRIGDLPMIRCWPKDGGAFVLLPQVFSMDPAGNSVSRSNLGMYRIQMSGGDYAAGKEVGLHYQIHRGIGPHHLRALETGRPLKVSIFIGGPPAHMLSAVMPLPEQIPEIFLAGTLAGRNFRYAVRSGFVVSADADFCITGHVMPGKIRREGPFGDHMGYYAMAHDFPYIEVDAVRHRRDAVYPFTVVGQPPQEDTVFGRLVHELAGPEIPNLLPGVTEVHAVDAAGVHPLLFAKAREGYEPYREREPLEILTHANAILGTGQLSLTKYLMICAREDTPQPDITDEQAFIRHVLERIDFSRDLHFQTCATMDTLDYSSERMNRGSKVIMAAAGEKKRKLKVRLPAGFSLPDAFSAPVLPAPGIVVLGGPPFSDYGRARDEIGRLADFLGENRFTAAGLPLFVVTDDPAHAAATFADFLWTTFTKSNPSHDIYGVDSFVRFKHWGCRDILIIDARKKPFHAPVLEPDKAVERRVDRLGERGGSLYGLV